MALGKYVQCTPGLAENICVQNDSSVRWAARYNTGLLIKLTPKGVVFSFLAASQDTDLVCLLLDSPFSKGIMLLMSLTCPCGLAAEVSVTTAMFMQLTSHHAGSRLASSADMF